MVGSISYDHLKIACLALQIGENRKNREKIEKKPKFSNKMSTVRHLLIVTAYDGKSVSSFTMHG